MANRRDQRLADASRRFFKHASKGNPLTPNAYKLLLALFRETIANDKRDTGVLTVPEICDIADLHRSTFGDAQSELEERGWLKVELGTKRSKIRTILIPGEGILYDLADPTVKRSGGLKRRSKRRIGRIE